MDRKTVIAYSTLTVLTSMTALISVLWFGTDSRLANVPGDFGVTDESPSIWILFATPALLVAAGLLFAWCVNLPQYGQLNSDAQRGLDQYRAAVRRFFIGIGVLTAMVQAIVILRTAGMTLPVDLDMRMFYFGFGVLFAAVGNVVPKLPQVVDRWFDAATYTKFNRFAGWVFTVGGILFCLSAVIAPIESLQQVTQIIIFAIIGLPVLSILLRAIFYSRKPA